jgi:hypothetical protein
MAHATMKYVIELALTVFLCAYLLPPAITAIATSTTTSWNPAVVIIFQVLLPILVIVTIALALMPDELSKKVGL